MVTGRTTGDLSELSTVIGELRNFAAQQSVTNTHMLDELKKIADRLTVFGEVGATFAEYRKTQHERWNHVHQQMGDIDERIDKVELKIDTMDDIINQWKGQMKTLVLAFGIGGTIISSLLSTYGGLLIKTLASHTP